MLGTKISINNKTKMGQWYKGDRFIGTDPLTGSTVSGKILGRAGKVSGKNKTCYNIQKDDGWIGWFDMSTITNVNKIEDDTEMIILFINDRVHRAKETEIQNWKDNGVFEIEDDELRCTKVI